MCDTNFFQPGSKLKISLRGEISRATVLLENKFWERQFF